MSTLVATGLVLHVDATTGVYQDSARTTPATADGDPVGGLTDQSGSGNHVTQATGAKRPVLKLAVRNGKNVILANGTSQWFNTPSLALSTAQTIFFVGQKTATNSAVTLGDQPSGSFVLNNTGGSTYFVPSGTTVTYLEAWTEWEIYCAVRSGTSVTWYRYNAVTASLTLGANSNLVISSLLAYNTSANFYSGYLAEVAIYNAALSAADIFTNLAALHANWSFTGTNIVCDGNSLTAGHLSSNNETGNYPAQLSILLGMVNDGIVNVGITNATTEQCNSRFSTATQPFLTPITPQPATIMIFWEGTNSLNQGDTAAAAYASLSTYVTNARAALPGIKILVGTCIAANLAPVIANRAAYNTLVLANTAGADGTIDFASRSELSDFNDTTYYQSDKIHLTTGGYAIVASMSKTAIQAVATIATSVGSLALGTVTQGSAGTPQSYTVGGTFMTANIVITAPTGVELSLDQVTWAGTETLTQANGVVATTTIYARIKSTASLGSISGNITHTSAGTTEQDVSVSGTVNAAVVASAGFRPPFL